MRKPKTTLPPRRWRSVQARRNPNLLPRDDFQRRGPMTPATARILPSRADAINVPRAGYAGWNLHTALERGELAALPDGSDLVNSWSRRLKARRVGVGDLSHAPLQRREAIRALVRRAGEPQTIDREIGW